MAYSLSFPQPSSSLLTKTCSGNIAFTNIYVTYSNNALQSCWTEFFFYNHGHWRAKLHTPTLTITQLKIQSMLRWESQALCFFTALDCCSSQSPSLKSQRFQCSGYRCLYNSACPWGVATSFMFPFSSVNSDVRSIWVASMGCGETKTDSWLNSIYWCEKRYIRNIEK